MGSSTRMLAQAPRRRYTSGMLNRLTPALLIAALLLPLAACGGTDNFARNIGLVRDAPDEFTVTTRAPLSMPPDLTTLPPPTPGASRPQEQSTRDAAAAAITPQAALAPQAPASGTPGMQAFLSETGPKAPADIRAEVDRASALERGSPSLTDRLMFWRDPAPPVQSVDAAKEAQRLRANAALGNAPDTGATPIIKPPPSRGLLNSLFGL